MLNSFSQVCLMRREDLSWGREKQPLTAGNWPGWYFQSATAVVQSWPETHSKALACGPVGQEHSHRTPASKQATLWPWWSETQNKTTSGSCLRANKRSVWKPQNRKHSSLLAFASDCCFFTNHSSSFTLLSFIYIRYDSGITELLLFPESIQSTAKLCFLKIPQSHLTQALCP